MGMATNIAKEIEQRRNILEQADKLKSKGLILSKISEIATKSQITQKQKKELGLRRHCNFIQISLFLSCRKENP
jgi:hypothetical protein